MSNIIYKISSDSLTRLKDLKLMIKENNTYLDMFLRGVELSFTYYIPSLDVYITNLIVK